MSKVRQAVDYERRLTEAEIAGHVAVRTEAFLYERKLTDAQFHEVAAVQDAHTTFHDREHLLYEDAIEKASAALRAQLAAMQLELDRVAEMSTGFMTASRFEREHAQLVERIDGAFARVDEKLNAEEHMTTRQAAQSELLDKIATQNRWLIGLAVGMIFSIVGIVAGFLKLY